MRAVGGGAGDVGEDGRVRGPAARRSPAPPRGGTGAVLPGAAPPCGRSPGERPHGRTPEPPVREMSKTAWSDYRRNPTVEICREWGRPCRRASDVPCRSVPDGDRDGGRTAHSPPDTAKGTRPSGDGRRRPSGTGAVRRSCRTGRWPAAPARRRSTRCGPRRRPYPRDAVGGRAATMHAEAAGGSKKTTRPWPGSGNTATGPGATGRPSPRRGRRGGVLAAPRPGGRASRAAPALDRSPGRRPPFTGRGPTPRLVSPAAPGDAAHDRDAYRRGGRPFPGTASRRVRRKPAVGRRGRQGCLPMMGA